MGSRQIVTDKLLLRQFVTLKICEAQLVTRLINCYRQIVTARFCFKNKRNCRVTICGFVTYVTKCRVTNCCVTNCHSNNFL